MNDHDRPGFLVQKARQTLIENGFDPEFDAPVGRQLTHISQQRAEIMQDIADMRSTLWSSIDNRTSRDLDQVEFAERLENGDISLMVAIADVDAYVEKDSPIDVRARQNTVSVYTPASVFPMLPEELSTDLTSLNPDEDRLAVVCAMTVKASGDVPDTTFLRAFVRNHAKLSYESVGQWFEGGEPPSAFSRIEGLEAQVRLQRETAERLYAYRVAKGALEFESIESSPVVEDGEVRDLESVRPNPARRLIENFMVAANVEMAEFLESHGQPSIRRVVRVPRRWDLIQRIAGEYGTNLPDEPDQPALAAFLEVRRQADPDHFPDLSLSIIKLIGSGEYVVERPGEDAGGHFGLAVRDYAHSTAPNRRFTDLVLQRLVKDQIAGREPRYTADELDQIALHCNLQEKAARKVERKMRKIVAATVMKRRVGENFDAIVTGVNQNGTFARILRPPVDGRIERNEHDLNVGEKVRVKLLSADPRSGFIDFAAL